MRRVLLLVTLPFVVDAVVALALAGPPAPPRPTAVDAYAVFFDWDQAALSPHAHTTLAQASRVLADGRIARLALLGAEQAGTGPSYDAALARARWRSVAVELAHDGVAPSQVVQAGTEAATLQPGGWPARRTRVASVP